MAAFGDGWRGWLLGIVATLIAGIVTNGIIFQRETRKDIAENNVRILQLQQRDENIIKYLQQLSETRINSVDAAMARLEKRIEELERRR